MGIKKSMWEYGKSILRELIKEPEKVEGKKAASLEDLKLDDLKKAKIRLGLAEDKTLNEVHEFESKKRKYFEDGVNAPGTREKRVYARKFKEMDSRANSKDILLDTLSQQTQLIDGLVQVKEMKETLDEIGIGSIVENLELSELSKYVDDATINGQFNSEKFKEMIQVLNGSGMNRQASTDEDLDDIMRAMEEASSARDNPEAFDQLYAEANTISKRKSKENPNFDDEE